MSFKISEVCDINSLNISKNDNLKTINYLDTANLNVGTVDELQYMEVGKDKIPSRAKRIVRKNDILISTVRPNQKHYGIIKNVAKNMVASTGFAVLTPKEDKVDPGYIYNYLIQDHITTYLHSIAESSTSAYPSIKPSVIGDLEVNLPPFEEQKAIAHILSTLDDKIEVNNQINRTLENMAQTIFKQWFVDFEFPNEDGEPYKSSGGEMVESELGMIPKGWEVGSIYSIADIIYGAPFSSKLFNEDGEGLPLIRIRDLKLGNPQFYTTEEHKKGTIIIPGDILIGMDAEFRPTIWSGKKAYLNQRVCQIKSNKDYIHDYYLYELIKPHMQFFEFSKVGTTVIHLGKSDIDSIKVIIPNTNYLESFSNIVAPLHDKLVSLSIENRKLRKIRDILLPKLMSGEIRVPMEEEGDAS